MVKNKEVMAENIKYFMAINRVNSADVCKALGFKQNTFSNWINAKIYPRIDKIEMMANYFGIKKADLVEDRISAFSSSAEYEVVWNRLGGNKRSLELSDVEYNLVLSYRKAEDWAKEAVNKLLEIETKKQDVSAI